MSRQLAISLARSQVIVRRRCAGSSLIASIIAVATDSAGGLWINSRGPANPCSECYIPLPTLGARITSAQASR
jgi:hypothetical protein